MPLTFNADKENNLMARLRNHQLKVYNTFNGGVQTVPADHLIQENAFTHAINDYTIDGTLRPQRSSKVLTPNPPLNTITILEENVKGVDVRREFDAPIKFVNYGDTIYYLKYASSPLYQLTPDDTAEERLAFPTLEGTVQTAGNATISDYLKKQYTDIDALYIDTKTTLVPFVAKYNYVKQIGYAHNTILDPLSDKWYYAVEAPADTLTVDTYKEATELTKTRLKELGDYLSLVIAETEGDFKESVRAVLNLPEVNTFYYNPVDRENSFKTIGGLTSYLIWTHAYRNSVPISQAYQYFIEGTMVKHAGNIAQMLRVVSTKSAFKYIALKYPTAGEEPTNHAVYWLGNSYKTVTVAKVAESALYGLDQIASLYLTHGNGLEPSEDDATLSTLLRSVLGDESIKAIYMAVMNIALMGGFARGDQSTPDTTWNTISLNETTLNVSVINQELKKFRDKLDKVKWEEAIHKIGKLGVVGIDRDTYAPSNLIESADIVLDPPTAITLTFATMPHCDVYKVYQYVGGVWMHLQDVTTSPATFNLTTPTGSVATDPYRLKEPKTDFAHIAEKGGVIYLARKGSQEVWYTYPNAPHSMDSTSFIKVPQPIKAMKSSGAGVFIWTNNNTLYLLKGTSDTNPSRNTLTIQLVAENVDVLDNSVCSVDTLVMWMSQYGIHNTSGFGSAKATSTFWSAESVDRCLQAFTYQQQGYWLVVKKDNTRALIAYDPSRKTIREIDAEGVLSVNEIHGELTLVRETDGVRTLEVIGKGDKLLPYKVGLKRYAGYSFDTRMKFTNVTIYHTAQPYKEIPYDNTATTKVKIYVDDWLVGEEVLQGSQATRVDLPNTNNTGYSIRLEFEGTLGIKSARVRYTTKDWED